MIQAARSPALLLLAVFVALVAPARAATLTSTLAVRVVVQPACTIAGATIDFGTYTSGQSTALNGFAQIAYSSCPAAQLRFQLDGGANGTSTARKLANGSGGLLNYGLYRDSARTQNFGQGTEARAVTPATSGTGTVPVYGMIPAGQSVAAGTYTDTVVITMDF